MMGHDSVPENYRGIRVQVSLMHIEDITDAGILAYQSLANAIFKGHLPTLTMFLQH